MFFQKSVLVIAIIALILILVLIGLALSSGSSGQSWPPIVGSCPDYWVDLSGNGEACFNTQSLGRCNIPTEGENGTKNFNVPPYNGADGLCKKFQWSQGCGMTWDGIKYGVSNPCSTTTTETMT